VLYRHPAVGECAVVGMPDPVKGELARAFVVRRPGARPTGEELDAYCRQHLAGYKVPRAWEFVDELPKSATGKILKRILRDRTPGPTGPA
jgi:long-chain acyl-CoA synthetase